MFYEAILFLVDWQKRVSLLQSDNTVNKHLIHDRVIMTAVRRRGALRTDADGKAKLLLQACKEK